MSPDGVMVRAIRAGDEPVARRLFHASRAADFTALPGGDAAVQAIVDLQFAAHTSMLATRFPDAFHGVITVGHADAGRIVTNSGPAGIRVVDIAVFPEFQGRGVGTRVLTALLDEADDLGFDVELSVWDLNERAIALYSRLGFRSIGIAGGYRAMKRPARLHGLGATA